MCLSKYYFDESEYNVIKVAILYCFEPDYSHLSDFQPVLAGVANYDSSRSTNASFYCESIYIPLRTSKHACVKLSSRHAIMYGPT